MAQVMQAQGGEARRRPHLAPDFLCALKGIDAGCGRTVACLRPFPNPPFNAFRCAKLLNSLTRIAHAPCSAAPNIGVSRHYGRDRRTSRLLDMPPQCDTRICAFAFARHGNVSGARNPEICLHGMQIARGSFHAGLDTGSGIWRAEKLQALEKQR